MKNLHLVILPILAIFFIMSGCKNGGNRYITEVISEFPIEEALKPDLTVTPQGSENITNSVNMAGQYVVCVDYNTSFLLSVYNQDFSLTDTIISKGHGHNELLSALYFGQWSGSSTNPNMVVFDMDRKLVVSLNIPHFKGLDMIADLSNVEDLSPSKIQLLKDSSLIGINLPVGQQSQLFKYDITQTRTIFSSDNIEFTEETAFYTSQCGLAVSSDEKLFVTPYYSLPLLCIYDEKLDLKKKIFIDRLIDTKDISLNDSFPGFVDAKFIGEKIAALLIDPSGKDESKLLVFDKDGSPLASYSLGNSLGFCFDESNQRIISLQYDDEAGTMSFFIYNIPPTLS